jgi:hypothetical protein
MNPSIKMHLYFVFEQRTKYDDKYKKLNKNVRTSYVSYFTLSFLQISKNITNRIHRSLVNPQLSQLIIIW